MNARKCGLHVDGNGMHIHTLHGMHISTSGQEGKEWGGAGGGYRRGGRSKSGRRRVAGRGGFVYCGIFAFGACFCSDRIYLVALWIGHILVFVKSGEDRSQEVGNEGTPGFGYLKLLGASRFNATSYFRRSIFWHFLNPL